MNYDFLTSPENLIYHADRNPLGLHKSRIAKSNLLRKNLEFKKSLMDLLVEFEEGSKLAHQVKFAVAWDEGEIERSGFELESLLGEEGHYRRDFHGQTHILVHEPSDIPVFLLKLSLSSGINHRHSPRPHSSLGNLTPHEFAETTTGLQLALVSTVG